MRTAWALVALLALALAAPAAAEAKRINIWAGFNGTVTLTDVELTRYHDERGVGGIVAQTNHLYSMGGSNKFTGSAAEVTSGAEFAAQRQLRDTNICARAAARGIKIYLGFWATDYHNTAAPFGNWHDNARWTNTILPNVRGLAGAAKLYGCAGLALDDEEYGGGDGRLQTWRWSYPGNPNGEAATRALVKQRGTQLMQAAADAFPGVELKIYYWDLPGSFEQQSRITVHNQASIANDYPNMMFSEFFDGLAEATGWGRIDFWDAWFYKDIGCNASCSSWFPGYNGTFPNVVQEAGRRHWAYLDPLLSAAQRAKMGYTSFTWIDRGPSASYAGDDPMPVATVRAQLLASRDQGTTPEIPVYHWCGNLSPIDGCFNYTNGAPGGGNYVPAMAEAAQADAPPPPPDPGTIPDSGTVLVNGAGRAFPPAFSVPHGATVDVGDTLTFEAVVRLNALGQLQVLAGKGNLSLTPAIGADGTLIFYGNNLGSLAQSSIKLAAGQTYTLHYVSGPGVKRVYINGSDVTVGSNTLAALAKTTLPLWVGADSGGSAPFAGTMRDVRLYGRALSATEVSQRHQALNAPADTTPPTTTISSGPADGSSGTSTSASFSFTSNEAGSSFDCRTDNAAFASCTSPRDYSGLSVGAHTFSVRATDPAGNVGAAATRSWTVEPTCAGECATWRDRALAAEARADAEASRADSAEAEAARLRAALEDAKAVVDAALAP